MVTVAVRVAVVMVVVDRGDIVMQPTSVMHTMSSRGRVMKR
jgi:hypothetical protein